MLNFRTYIISKSNAALWVFLRGILITLLFTCGIFLKQVFAETDDFDLEAIVVTKSRVHLINPFSIESDFIDNSPFSSPFELLTFTPLDLQNHSQKAGVHTDFSLRGSTYQGVLVLVNGQRINDPQTAHHNCDVPFTRQDIERIEVIPGLSSSLFGPDAVGGAINIILKAPKGEKKVLEFSSGSYQTNSGMVSITDRVGDLDMRLSLDRQESGGFYYDTDFKKFTASFKSSLDIPDGEFNVDLGYLENEFGAYDYYTPGRGYASKEWVKTCFLNLGLDLDKQGVLIKPNFLWRRHYDKFMLDKTSASPFVNHHRTDLFTPSIYCQRQSEFLGTVGMGIEYGEERIHSTNLGRRSRVHKSISIDDSKELTDDLVMGVSSRVDDYDEFKNAYSGSIKLRYNLIRGNSLHFGLSRSIRVPCFTELYYSDSTTVGNSDLSEEKALNYEAGMDHKGEKVSLGATFFIRQEKDFIDWVKRTSSQALWKSENITEAQVMGTENYLRVNLRDNLILDNNYTYVNKCIDDTPYLYKYGQNYARHILTTVLHSDFPFGKQSVGLVYKKKPHRDGWVLLNVHLSYKFHKNGQVFLNTTNLLNVEYQEVEGIPQPGCGVEAGVRLEW